MINVSLKGAFNLCRVALRHFASRNSCVIVNLASLAVQCGGGWVGGAHYASSKGGVISLTHSNAREFGPPGIRADVICLGMAPTGILDGIPDDELNAIRDSVLLRRLAMPGEVAAGCLFFGTELSSFVTVVTLDGNGGRHIH